MVFRKENNIWSKPVNMGPTINSSYDEISPFYILMVLFFYSSNNEKYCGYDIFVIKKIKQLWPTAENLGIPINTVFNENIFQLQ